MASFVPSAALGGMETIMGKGPERETGGMLDDNIAC